MPIDKPSKGRGRRVWLRGEVIMNEGVRVGAGDECKMGVLWKVRIAVNAGAYRCMQDETGRERYPPR